LSASRIRGAMCHYQESGLRGAWPACTDSKEERQCVATTATRKDDVRGKSASKPHVWKQSAAMLHTWRKGRREEEKRNG